ncbi:MAG TPA: MerR family transcriptional regulator [Thermoanaerobaculia bacterium]|nr:MerR family transcriptional regulator [Thermoanaerobaculia bacterium]
MAENQEVPVAADAKYRIGDVCRLADVQPYVLRYWESEFPALAPDRSVPGPRLYSARELKIVERVKKLLYDEGYTIAGAKKKLDVELKGGAEPSEAPPPEPPSPVVPKPRRREKVSAPVPADTEQPPMFAEEAAVPAELPTAMMQVEPLDSGRAKAVKATPDPRLEKVVAELKEIKALLSREP